MLTGWPAGGNVTPTFDRALYHLRRRAENWGFHDKYHALERPEWQDDDFYGAIADLSEELYTDRTLLRSLEKAIRDHLAGVAPVIVPVPLSALSVVSYESDDFVSISGLERLQDLLKEPGRIQNLLPV